MSIKQIYIYTYKGYMNKVAKTNSHFDMFHPYIYLQQLKTKAVVAKVL